MPNNQIKLFIATLVVIISAAFLFWEAGSFLPEVKVAESPSPSVLSENTQGVSTSLEASDSADLQKKVLVTKVIDGDTIEVEIDGRKQSLRYIGIDTPETVHPQKGVQCFGREASSKNKELVEGKTIYIEKDVSEADKYGRLLGYVYLRLDDGSFLFVNDYLVRQGYAQAVTFPPDVKFSERLGAAQREARDNKRGLWGRC